MIIHFSFNFWKVSGSSHYFADTAFQMNLTVNRNHQYLDLQNTTLTKIFRLQKLPSQSEHFWKNCQKVGKVLGGQEQNRRVIVHE